MGTIMAAVAALLIHMDLLNILRLLCSVESEDLQEGGGYHEAEHHSSERGPAHHQGSQGNPSVETFTGES